MTSRIPGVFLVAAMVVSSVVRAEPPVLSPGAGAVNVCPDTPLRLSFSEPVSLGAGTIEIRAADDDTLLDSITFDSAPVRGPGGGRGPVTGAARTTAPAPVAGVSAIRIPGQVLPRDPLTGGLPTRVRSIGGSGFVTYPIMIFGKEVYVFPAATLPYGKSISVKVSAGLFKVGGDNPGSIDETNWRFTTKAAEPARDAGRLVVAADGSGDFCTVQGAIDHIPTGITTPRTIFIRKGVYYEIVDVGARNKLTFLGEDRKSTTIAYPNNATFSSSQPTIGGGAMRAVPRGMFNAGRVSDLVLANLTLHNITPQGGSQAEAIILRGTTNARAILTNVDLYSFQDTLQINGQAYLSHCYIEGDVDFMWGTGPCFFEDCHVTTVRNNAYYTQIRNTAANHGYVYRKCLFDGAPGITGNVLSRIDPNRFPASEVVLLECTLSGAVSDAAWRFDGNAPAANNVHFWEYGSFTPAGDAVDVSKRFAASRQLIQPEDAELIKNYSDPKWVLGGWEPQLAPIITSQPVSLVCAAGQKVAFNVEVAAVPDAVFQWQKDGADLPGATQAALTIAAVSSRDAGRYAVVASNSAGKVVSAEATLALAGN